jgi:hypothetical protein
VLLVMANGAVVVDVSLLLGWMYSVRYAIEKAIQPKIDCIICSMLNTNWYSNIGTTHHITSELNNLFVRDTYHGRDKVNIASGQDMDIRVTSPK